MFMTISLLCITLLRVTCDRSILSTALKVYTRDVFYVRREVDLMKTAKENAYIMHIFGKIELLYIYICNLKLFQNALL